ncbi:RNA exonuclease 3 [Smittium culicis]|uniref:RNA exonuclease 3 n=1 Tax=Smittium culicis TaxID=133412 RepID=A0A1R1XW68_9FUNG|nr:RNA exonuclease 3 [Smittium culicis]
MFSSDKFSEILCPYIASNIDCPTQDLCAFNHNMYRNNTLKKKKNIILNKNKKEFPKIEATEIEISNDNSLSSSTPLFDNSKNSNPFLILSQLDINSPSGEKLDKAPAKKNVSNSQQKIKKEINKTIETIGNSSSCPVLKAESNFRIPWATRQKTLEKIYNELLRVYKDLPDILQESISAEALKRENSIYSSSNPHTYRNTAVGVLTSLKREKPRPLDEALHTGEPGNLSFGSKCKSMLGSSSAQWDMYYSKNKKLDLGLPELSQKIESLLMTPDNLVLFDFPLEAVIKNHETQTIDDLDESLDSYLQSALDQMGKLQNSSTGYNRIRSNEYNNKFRKIQPEFFVNKNAFCSRCKKSFTNQLPSEDKNILLACSYHHGKLVVIDSSTKSKTGLFMKPKGKAKGGKNEFNREYSCCKGNISTPPCDSGPHIFRIVNDGLLHSIIPYVSTMELENENAYKLLALDCEMCYSTIGIELTRVTIIDHDGVVILDELVKIYGEVLDLNTRYSGVSSLDDAKYNFKEIQEKIMKMISKDTILLGHGLENDLRALRIVHGKVIDTVDV